MRPTVYAFLRDLAEYFRQGDMQSAAAPYEMPGKIAIAGQSLYVQDADQACAMLAVYRDNLDVQAYARTELTLLHEMDGPDGTRQALLTWHHKNTSNAEIGAVNASYFLRPLDAAPWWSIVLIEIIDVADPRLTAGLPIH